MKDGVVMNVYRILFLCFFVPIFYLIYYLIPNKFRNGWLLVGSLLFFVLGKQNFIWYFLLSSCFTYIGMHVLANLPRNMSRRKVTLWMIGILVLLWFLFVRFEYGTIYPVSYAIILLQNIGTLFDFKKKVPTIFSYLTYISCFPNVLLGPVLSYFDMEDELKKRKVTKEDFSLGMFSFIKGIGIGVILITFLSMCLDRLLLEQTILSSFVVIVLTMLQVMLWFQSYFEISFGLSRMLGFHFEKSTSLHDFGIVSWWKRYGKGLSKWICFFLTSLAFGMNGNIILWFLVLSFVGSKKWLVLFSFVLLVRPSIQETVLGLVQFPFSNLSVNYDLKSYLLMILISFVVAFGLLDKVLKQFSVIRDVFYVVVVFLIFIFLVSGVENSIWFFMI